jgi:hypothetical protein
MIPDALSGKRLVLFGAGRVGQEFLAHFPELQVLAVADNDPLKHGSRTHGIEIIAPQAILELDYDLVVVTTGWWKSISAQLQELGIDAQRIALPPKSMLAVNHGRHPFADPATKAFATRVMQSLWLMAQKQGVRFCLDFGTLLGACREQDFIAWDDDIDLALIDDDFPALIDALPALKAALPSLPGVQARVAVYSSATTPAAAVITFLDEQGSGAIVPFEVSFLRRVFENDVCVTKGYGTEFIAPPEHFQGYEQLTFLDRRFNVPQRPEGYLDFVYGNWKQPMKNTTLADYPTQEPDYQQPSKASL